MKKNLKTNLIFAGVLVVIALGLLIWQVATAKPGMEAVLTCTYTGKVYTFPLDEDGRYDVDTSLYTVHIEVADGAARFVDSPCPDHLCEGFGWQRNVDNIASCLPARAVLTIEAAA